ncbi:MAG: hypothetical protein IKM13_13535 [Clostridia bacterium]|nr:hypothetical protein [Clostridia bacterium]
MKHTFKRITALFLVLLMTSSLLASCSGEADEASDEPKTVAVYDDYVANTIDLGLAEDEAVMEVIEVDGKIRATIGTGGNKTELDGIEIERSRNAFEINEPYFTEHRYYDMDFVEDTQKREKTKSTHEVALLADPAVDFVYGAEPFLFTGDSGISCYAGVEYFFYRDGEALEGVIIPEGYRFGGGTLFEHFNARAHVMLHEDVVYAGTNYDCSLDWDLFVNDHFVEMPSWRPGAPEYIFCGLIGVDGIPYGLIHAWENDKNGQVVNTLWEETRMVPLTPETTELPLEGTKIDGIATGGAFSDGKYGYYMCGSELWRTDGKESKRIADLIFNGVNEMSKVRAVRPLSDGRILVVVGRELIELSPKTDGTGDERKVFTIGVLNLFGDPDELVLTLSKFNRISDEAAFVVKEFDNKASLNLAILSGEVAMVATRDQFMLKNYIKQELLSPLEEVAPELFEQDVLIESVVDATKVNGTCYYLPRHFEIRAIATDPSVLEEGQTFETRQEYYDFLLEKDPEGLKIALKRDWFVYYAQEIDEWINFESNTAHFDDGSFEALLEFCNHGGTQDEVDFYAMNPSSTRVYNSSMQLLGSIQSNYFTDVKAAKEYQANPPQLIQAPRVIYPMPSSVHDGYEMFARHYFAVVDNEVSREAAGDFLRWHFLEDVVEEFPMNERFAPMTSYGQSAFSVNRDETDRYLARNINSHIEVEEVNDESFYDVLYNMTCGQEQYDKTWEIIRQADHFQYFRNEVFDVMYEEAGRYFAGNITAKQAAEYVQNRISLYLAEQG